MKDKDVEVCVEQKMGGGKWFKATQPGANKTQHKANYEIAGRNYQAQLRSKKIEARCRPGQECRRLRWREGSWQGEVCRQAACLQHRLHRPSQAASSLHAGSIPQLAALHI